MKLDPRSKIFFLKLLITHDGDVMHTEQNGQKDSTQFKNLAKRLAIPGGLALALVGFKGDEIQVSNLNSKLGDSQAEVAAQVPAASEDFELKSLISECETRARRESNLLKLTGSGNDALESGPMQNITENRRSVDVWVDIAGQSYPIPIYFQKVLIHGSSGKHEYRVFPLPLVQADMDGTLFEEISDGPANVRCIRCTEAARKVVLAALKASGEVDPDYPLALIQPAKIKFAIPVSQAGTPSEARPLSDGKEFNFEPNEVKLPIDLDSNPEIINLDSELGVEGSRIYDPALSVVWIYQSEKVSRSAMILSASSEASEALSQYLDHKYGPLILQGERSEVLSASRNILNARLQIEGPEGEKLVGWELVGSVLGHLLSKVEPLEVSQVLNSMSQEEHHALATRLVAQIQEELRSDTTLSQTIREDIASKVTSEWDTDSSSTVLGLKVSVPISKYLNVSNSVDHGWSNSSGTSTEDAFKRAIRNVTGHEGTTTSHGRYIDAKDIAVYRARSGKIQSEVAARIDAIKGSGITEPGVLTQPVVTSRVTEKRFDAACAELEQQLDPDQIALAKLARNARSSLDSIIAEVEALAHERENLYFTSQVPANKFKEVINNQTEVEHILGRRLMELTVVEQFEAAKKLRSQACIKIERLSPNTMIACQVRSVSCKPPETWKHRLDVEVTQANGDSASGYLFYKDGGNSFNPPITALVRLGDKPALTAKITTKIHIEDPGHGPEPAVDGTAVLAILRSDLESSALKRLRSGHKEGTVYEFSTQDLPVPYVPHHAQISIDARWYVYPELETAFVKLN